MESMGLMLNRLSGQYINSPMTGEIMYWESIAYRSAFCDEYYTAILAKITIV